MPDIGIYALSAAVKKSQAEFFVQSNNLANMNNHGFKADFAIHKSIEHRPIGAAAVSYPIEGPTALDVSQGILQTTGRALDVAIVGSGWFKVLTPLGIRYTRNGNFSLNNERILVNQSGFPVLSADGEQIQLDPTDIDPIINGDGSVVVSGKLRGFVGIVGFDNDKIMRKLGNNLYVTEQNEATATGKIAQGALEQSNVNSIASVTSLMQLERDHTLAINQINDQYNLERVAIKSYSKLGG